MQGRGGGGGGGLGANNHQQQQSQQRSLLQPSMPSMIQHQGQHLQQPQRMQQHYQQQQQLQNQQHNQRQQLPGQAMVVQQQQQQIQQQQQQLPQVVDEALMRKIQEKQNYLKTTYIDALNSIKDKINSTPQVKTIFTLINTKNANPAVVQGLQQAEKALHNLHVRRQEKLAEQQQRQMPQQRQMQGTNSSQTQMMVTSSTSNQPSYQMVNNNSSGASGPGMMNIHQQRMMMTNNGNQQNSQPTIVRMIGHQNQNHQIPQQQQQVRMMNVIRSVSNNNGLLPGSTVVHHRQQGPPPMALQQQSQQLQNQQIKPNIVQQQNQQLPLNNNGTSIPPHVLQHMKPNVQQTQPREQHPKVVIHHQQQQNQQQAKVMFNRDPNNSNANNFRQPQPMSNVFQNVNQRMESFAATRAASPSVPANINNQNQNQNMPKSPAVTSLFQHQQQQQPSPGFLVQQPSPTLMSIKSPSTSQHQVQQPNQIVQPSQLTTSTASASSQQPNRCQLHEKMANLVEAVRRSMDRDQTTHLLLVQEAFAPALSVLHHRTAFSPRNLTFTSSNVPEVNKSNSNKRKRTASSSSAQTCLQRELFAYSDRFSFTPVHRKMTSPSAAKNTPPDYDIPLPTTLLVRVVDPQMPNFPPATLYLPAGYPDAPAALMLSEDLWGPLVSLTCEPSKAGSLFERVRSLYVSRVGMLTQMNILRQLDLLHGCIRQVITDECSNSNKRLRKSSSEEKVKSAA